MTEKSTQNIFLKKLRKQVILYLKIDFRLSNMEAEDLAHDAIYSYLVMKEGRDIKHPVSYVKRIARNQYLMNQRSSGLQLTRTKDVAEYLHKIEAGDNSEVENRFIQQVKAKEYGWTLLGDLCKKILEAFYLKNQKLKDLSKSFNHGSVNTTKVQKSRCLAAIRKNSQEFLQKKSRIDGRE